MIYCVNSFDRLKRTFFSKKTFFQSVLKVGTVSYNFFLKRLDKVGNFYLFIIYLFKVFIK